tara:strand:- start:1324 stop:2214 length:891 start_codon:yes stop_codon:yes gene_type:complete
MPLLTIGVPVYNGAKFIERALESLLAQTFKDFIILVSDNASTDATADMVRSMAEKDRRIRLVQQPENLGAATNFMSLAMRADTEFFMWAAADDFWSVNYIEASVSALKSHRNAGFASGGFASVNFGGEILRYTDSFDMLAGQSSLTRLFRYTLLKEASGKANPIYSVFRTPLVQEIVNGATETFSEWGGDMALVAAALARAPYVQDRRATLFKQIGSERDGQTSVDVSKNDYSSTQFGGAFAPQILPEFTATMTRRLLDQRQKQVVAAVLRLRLVSVYAWEVKQRTRNLRAKLERH